jgi:hypothetical protein
LPDSPAENDHDVANVAAKLDNETSGAAAAEPKPNVADEAAGAFAQFWTLIRPRVLTNVSAWKFVADKSIFCHEAAASEASRDARRLERLLREVDALVEQVSIIKISVLAEKIFGTFLC